MILYVNGYVHVYTSWHPVSIRGKVCTACNGGSSPSRGSLAHLFKNVKFFVYTCTCTSLLSPTPPPPPKYSYVAEHSYYYNAVGAMDPRCKICIFMGKTDPQAPKHLQQVHTYN